MSEIAATADNFSAHLAEMDAGGMDGGDAPPQNDYTGGRQGVQALKQATRDQQGHVNPEHRVGEDGRPLRLDARGMTSANDQNATQGFEGDEPPTELQEDEQGEQAEQEGEEQTPDGIPPYEHLQEMYRALEGPDLHEGLWDKTIPTPVNGVTVPKSIRELRDGFMRMSDYSRGQQEKAAAIKQAQQAISNTRQTLERLQDPAVLRATLRRLGPQHEQALFQAAHQIAQEYTRLNRATPSEREAILRAMELERRAEAAEEAARRAPQEPEQPPHAQHVPVIHQTLEAWLPRTWEHYGLAPSPVAMQEFTNHIQHVWDGRMETIPQAVERATIATIEVLGDRAQQHRQFIEQRRPQQPQPLAPRRLPAPIAAPRAPNRPQAGARVTDFDAHIKGLGR